MSTPTHTPPPWTVVARKDGLKNIYIAGTFYDIALCVRPHDAALICAAPEMLAELKAWRDDCPCQKCRWPATDGCSVCEATRALITRIEGPTT